MNEISEAQYHMFFESERYGRWRIFPKGRRLGATKGAAIAFTKWMQEGEPLLWGDTVNSNIDRYVERYFIPFYRKNNIKYKWNAQKKLLQVGDGYTDFRSADRPENWEGFGYKKIFLNEAGLILDDEYLYYNAVLPMMIDYPDSTLIAAGTPKLSRGVGALFQKLWLNVEMKAPGYYGKQFSTYDNPYLNTDSIKALEQEIAACERPQEIWGKFIESAGIAINFNWFRRYQVEPANPTMIVQSWDTASSEKQINDPSVCTTWKMTPNGFYLIDVYRAWVEYPSLKRAVVNLAEKYNPNVILIENKSTGQALIPDLRNEMRFPITPIEPLKDKVTRALVESTIMEAGKVFIPERAPWLFDYEKEWTDFPKCETFDQIDSTSQFLKWTRSRNGIFIG